MKTTTLSGSGTATGFSRIAFTTEKMAVLAPMPNVSAATAARLNAGLCTNIRSACFTSLSSVSSIWGFLLVSVVTVATGHAQRARRSIGLLDDHSYRFVGTDDDGGQRMSDIGCRKPDAGAHYRPGASDSSPIRHPTSVIRLSVQLHHRRSRRGDERLPSPAG